MFEAAWYLDQAGASAADAYEHYERIGVARGIPPAPLFDLAHYAALFAEIDFRTTNPIAHYLGLPVDRRRDPHPLFDRDFYRKSGPELPDGVDPFLHYIESPEGRGRSPHPLFDTAFYFETRPDVAAGGMLPLRHYVLHGAREGVSPHILFDSRWYVAAHPDAAEWDNPLLHYLAIGAPRNYSPHPLFDPDWYVSQTADPKARQAPLQHYIDHGSAAGLSPHPLFDPGWYRRTQMPPGETLEPLAHFLSRGEHEGCDPNPLFSTAWYRNENPDVARDGWNMLLHYVRYGAAERRDPHPAFVTEAYIRRNPECTNVAAGPLAHALVRYRPGSGRPLETATPLRKRLVKAEAAQPAPTQRFLGIPRHRRYLAEIVAGESDDESARRIVGYFDIIEALGADGGRDVAGRQGTLAALVERMQLLSAQANDDRPVEASVIIPAYNHVEYTIAAVLAVLEHKSNCRFEIIIGNNISADETREVFEAVGGILRCVTHAVNGGFIRNCNLSALHATGSYIALLNNDTLVFDHWLDELLAPFARFHNVGFVGSKLLMGDGALQEAGAIMWRDASGWNFGRNKDSTLPEFNYAKDTDWVSGASIAIPKSVWDENGGFDERYVPAYFDDSDLAFSLRAKGYRSIYSPTSVLVHHEGITHGTDTSSGIKAYQLENQRKFVEKWQHVLAAENFESGEELFLARDKSGAKPHILIADHYVPQFDKDAGSRSIYEYCAMFADAGFQVSFWPDNLYYDRSYVRALQAMGIEVLYGSQHVGQFPAWIEQNGRYLDYVLLSRPHVSQKYIHECRQHSPAKIIYFGHDLHYARLEKEYAVTGNREIPAEIDYWRALETEMWENSDLILYPAEDEVEAVAAQVPDKLVRRVTLYMYPDSEIEAVRSQLRQQTGAAAPSLLFVGGYRHRPNVDAALWLVRQVLPLVKRRYPELVTMLAGSFPPPEVTELAGSDVVVTGYISDSLLQQLYRTTSVALAPLRFGGGVKGKIIEALRFGVPVVTTTPGTQGIPDAPEFTEVGDSAEAFADCILRLLGNPNLRYERALRGLEFVEQEYAYRSVVRRMAVDVPELGRILEGRGTLRR
ncbi:MAG TPA: glycosyltransferase [Stellaceae bacterium]|nr:glycosyltransferase [Stellaceae bacterium]